MQTYIGTKIIKATPMSRVDVEARIGLTIGGKETGEGYLVQYPDGYESWSPKDVFEEAYRPMKGMTFGLAIESLKKGLKVCRAGWNGRGMWLNYVPDDQWGLGSGQHYDYGKVGNRLLPWIGMRTADGAFVPWLASQTDILAEDWEIVE